MVNAVHISASGHGQRAVPSSRGTQQGPLLHVPWAGTATGTGAASAPPQGVDVTLRGRPAGRSLLRAVRPSEGSARKPVCFPGVGSMPLSRGAGTCVLPSSTAGGRRQPVWCRGPSVPRLGRGWRGVLSAAESELHRTVPGAGWRPLTHGAGPVAPSGARPHQDGSHPQRALPRLPMASRGSLQISRWLSRASVGCPHSASWLCMRPLGRPRLTHLAVSTLLAAGPSVPAGSRRSWWRRC